MDDAQKWLLICLSFASGIQMNLGTMNLVRMEEGIPHSGEHPPASPRIARVL